MTIKDHGQSIYFLLLFVRYEVREKESNYDKNEEKIS